MTTDTQPMLKVALFGVGRLGSIRARILVSLSPRIDLVAVCDPKPGSEKWVADNLPARVKFFSDPEECMLHSGAEAVLISTATATHAPLVLMALELDLVSGSERLANSPACHGREAHRRGHRDDAHSRRGGQEEAAPQAARALLPSLYVSLKEQFAYSTVDDSYRNVKRMVDAGELGEIHAVETSCLDQQDPTGT